MAKKKRRRSRPKPATGRQLNLWVKPDTVAILDLLARKWSNEGKIPASRSAAFAHMVQNFGELARLSPSGGAILPLSASRRNTLSFLAKVFARVGVTKDESDLEAVGFMIEYAFDTFKDETFLDRFLESRGRARPGQATSTMDPRAGKLRGTTIP